MEMRLSSRNALQEMMRKAAALCGYDLPPARQCTHYQYRHVHKDGTGQCDRILRGKAAATLCIAVGSPSCGCDKGILPDDHRQCGAGGHGRSDHEGSDLSCRREGRAPAPVGETWFYDNLHDGSLMHIAAYATRNRRVCQGKQASENGGGKLCQADP